MYYDCMKSFLLNSLWIVKNSIQAKQADKQSSLTYIERSDQATLLWKKSMFTSYDRHEDRYFQLILRNPKVKKLERNVLIGFYEADFVINGEYVIEVDSRMHFLYGCAKKLIASNELKRIQMYQLGIKNIISIDYTETDGLDLQDPKIKQVIDAKISELLQDYSYVSKVETDEDIQKKTEKTIQVCRLIRVAQEPITRNQNKAFQYYKKMPSDDHTGSRSGLFDNTEQIKPKAYSRFESHQVKEPLFKLSDIIMVKQTTLAQPSSFDIHQAQFDKKVDKAENRPKKSLWSDMDNK